MSVVYMNRVDFSGGNYAANLVDIPPFEYEETLAIPGAGNEILMPPGCTKLSVSLVCSSSSGKVQFTTSPIANVKAGTAVWQDWPAGIITVTDSDELARVTAIRQYNSTGTTVLEVLAY